MGVTRAVSFSLLFSFTLVLLVSSFPRKTLVSRVTTPGGGNNRRSSRLTSVLSDYWAERGFHEALTDHLLASESQAKDLMMTGDEMEDFKGLPKIRIPRERLTPPAPPQRSERKQRIRVRRPRLRLSPATRKQDLEIMESVTLVDGGTQLPDGRIQIRPSLAKSQRKQHQEPYGNDQFSPLSYHLQDDLDRYKIQKQQQQQQLQTQESRQPSLFDTYRTLPMAFQQFQQQQQHQGKPVVSHKAPKSIHHFSLSQFQKQLQQNEKLQQEFQSPMYPPPTSSPSPPIHHQQHSSVFVLPPPPKPQVQQQQQAPRQNFPQQPPPPHHSQQQPSPPQNLEQQPPSQHFPQPTPSQNPMAQQAPRQNLQQQQQVAYNAQLFRQQFQHPFSPPPSAEPSPLAKFTASLLSTASGVAAATSAAAAALKQSQIGSSSFLQLPPSPPPGASPSISSAAASPYPVSVPNPELPPQYYPVAASDELSPQILLPTTTYPPPSTSLRPGVVADDEQATADLQNQLIEPQNIAKQLTMLYETGRKILYFPKGVVDTVDTFLKQMERNPMVAYWGDKFFAKVFGDTSGT